jgi:HK97 family phage major capsid protein
MSSNVIDLKTLRDRALAASEEIVSRAERQWRPLTHVESELNRKHTREAADHQSEIDRIASRNLITSTRSTPTGDYCPKTFSSAYRDAFGDYIASGGTTKSASLQESVSTGGGYAVPVEVDGQIVPLAPTDCALRRLAIVRETVSDIKVPSFATFGTPINSPVTEGSAFTENDPTLGQFTLSAFMVGSQRDVSLELIQDRKTFVDEIVNLDCAADQLMYEESAYIGGSGSGQPQGLIGNVGAGVTQEADGSGNLVSLAGIDALIASLKSAYLSNASFLMSRATGLIIRTAQVVNGVYVNAWHRENGQDFLRGFPVEFSDAMPAAARGAAPALFGDFRRGYVIGDRGGSALRVKVAYQTLATSGMVTVIAYRRTDGRVRRSEAIQQYNVSAS